MPNAYGYARVSHTDGIKKGESVPSQSIRITEYYERVLLPDGVTWGGVKDDGTNISAYRTMFRMRPAGRELMLLLKPGDHLIVDKVDRFWRSMKDFVLLMEEFTKRNITVHIVNFLGQTITNGNQMGDFILKQFVLIAELESSIKSERTKEALAMKRRKGHRIGSSIPPGTRIIPRTYGDERGIVKTLHWCERKRTVMAEIVRLIDDEGLEWVRAFTRIEKFIATLEGRPERTIAKQYTDRNTSWRNMYLYEVAYRYLGIREPCEIPPLKYIKMAARQHRRERTENRGNVHPGWKYTSEIEAIPPMRILEMAGIVRISA